VPLLRWHRPPSLTAPPFVPEKERKKKRKKIRKKTKRNEKKKVNKTVAGVGVLVFVVLWGYLKWGL
jgi:hypothetical protein